MNRLLTVLWITLLSVSLQSRAQQKITLDDIFTKGTFRAQSVHGLRSMNDGLHYTTIEGYNKIVKYSYQSGNEVAVLLDLGKVDNAPITSFSDYAFSDDEKKILLRTDVRPIYRHSFTAEYYVWNSVTGELSALSDKGPQQLATFSPDGNRIAYVRHNNIYIKNLNFGSTSQATFDGKENEIINGAPDWVYEEEFGFNKAFWWSPDSKFLAYLQFDEREVPEFSMPLYTGQSPEYEQYRSYPGKKSFKYPKAGEKNSVVKVMSYEIKSKMNIPVQVGQETDQYIPRLKWSPSNELVIMRLNRLQNQLDLLYA
ncbi:MAG: DPP IV N-terminal domain-containing protein, partial [Draconibacterium sp.]